jgi:hypothetical protein
VSGQSSVSPRLLQSSDSLRHLVASRADHTPLASPTARRISNALRDLTATRTSRKASGAVVLTTPLKSRLSVSGAGGSSRAALVLNPLQRSARAEGTSGVEGSGGPSIGVGASMTSSSPQSPTSAAELPRRSSTLTYYKGPMKR